MRDDELLHDAAAQTFVAERATNSMRWLHEPGMRREANDTNKPELLLSWKLLLSAWGGETQREGRAGGTDEESLIQF